MNLASRAWGLVCRLVGVDGRVWGRGLALATVAVSSGSAMAQNGSCCTSGVCAVTTQAACPTQSGQYWASGYTCSPVNPCQSVGPDIIVCSFPDVSNNTPVTINGIVYDSFCVGTTSANKGGTPVSWLASPDNRHPAIAQNLFRYVPSLNRFEQLGQGSLKHGFTALQQGDCAAPNYFNFGCSSTAGTTLGIGCADPYCCGLNNGTSNGLGGMGPKWEVNAATGVFHSPYSSTYQGTNYVTSSGPPRARIADLQQAPSGTRYFMEGQYIVSDDAVATTAGVSNKNNNATWQEVTMSPLAGTAAAQSATNFDIALTGSPHREQSAIYAWKAIDSGVVIQTYDVPGDGRFILGVKVSGTGPYTYEYALHNMNSHRCAGSFLVPLPGAQSALTSVGFHDVEAVSEPNALSAANAGNPSADDWTQAGGSLDDTSVSWGGVAYAGTPAVYAIGSNAAFTPGTGNDHTANVIRWGSMFNFRFTSTLAPGSGGSVAVGLWRPGTGSAIIISNVPTPGGATVGTLTAQCCNAGVCSVTNQAGCPGTWGLPGTTCTPDPCAPGQCCDTGNCTVTTSGACSGTGTWSIGGTCSPNNCPPPTGACCPGASCTITTQAACPTGYQGHNTSCVSGPCPPANDSCANAIWLSDGVTYTGVNTNSQTDFSGGNLANCGTGTNSSADVWFKYRPATTASVRVTTNTVGGVGSTNFDTVISVHAACGSTTSIACNDDSGTPGNSSNIAAVALTANTTYYIRVAGYNGGTGTYSVRVIGGGGTAPTGACCAADGTCTPVTQAACTGTYQTDGSVCTPNPCPQPTGACCAAAGTCGVSAQAACSGTWTAAGSCSPNICPQPSGVCCRGATCTANMATEAACTGSVAAGSATHAVWASGASSCSAAAGGATPCCYADYNKTGGTTVGDIFDYLNDWFAGYKYAVVGGDGVHGTLSVQDIFDYLNIWFAGGC
jgi:hypothetical protein